MWFESLLVFILLKKKQKKKRPNISSIRAVNKNATHRKLHYLDLILIEINQPLNPFTKVIARKIK